MKHLYRILSLLLALSLLPILSGCTYLFRRMEELTDTDSAESEQAPDGTPPPAPVAPRPDQIPDGTAVRIYPAPVPEDAEPNATAGGARLRFASAKTLAAWREPLVRLLSSAAATEARAVALFDVTGDTVPEVLLLRADGDSAASDSTYAVCDLFTGEALGTLEMGSEEGLTLYYSTKERVLYAMVGARLHGGADTDVHLLSLLAHGEARGYFTAPYLRAEFLCAPTPEVEDTADASEEGRVLRAERYLLYGEEIAPAAYAEELSRIHLTLLRLPETEAIPVLRGEGMGASELADALLSSGQAFLATRAAEGGAD